MAEATKDTNKAEKVQRYHVEKDGIKRKVVDTYYDPKLNCVIDVYEVTRSVRNSEKKTISVTTLRKTASQNEALQNKYRRNVVATPRMEVKIDE
jgi:hypothetical protein